MHAVGRANAQFSMAPHRLTLPSPAPVFSRPDTVAHPVLSSLPIPADTCIVNIAANRYVERVLKLPEISATADSVAGIYR